MATTSKPQSCIMLRIILVGDHGVGKSTMLNTYLKPDPINDSRSAYHHGFTQNVDLDGERFQINFSEVPSHDTHARTRPLNYVDSDVAICCFSCLDPPSQKAISNKWVSEMSNAGCLPKLLLVGTMTEHRENEESIAKTVQQFGRGPSKDHEGDTLAEFIRSRYLEVATLDEESVKQVFEAAIRLAHQSVLERKETKSSNCNIM